MAQVSHELRGASFGFYDPDEIRAISVKHIDSPIAFAGVNQQAPVIGGLYDPGLGPVDAHVTCPTCTLDHQECPGHIGHIELATPVYNPLLFPLMYKLLRGKCFNCHRFKISRSVADGLSAQLALLHGGHLLEALELDDMKLSGASQLQTEEDGDEAVPDRRAELVELADTCAATPRVPGKDLSGHARAHHRKLLSAFYESLPTAVRPCESCSAFSPKLRKEGFVKLFHEPMSEKMARQMDALGMPLRAAIDKGSDMDMEDSDDEVGDEAEAASEGAKTATYLPPAEVQEQMRLLWENESGLLNLMFGLGCSDGTITGDKSFFVEVLPVPPARFRPPAMLNGQTIEHPHTAALQQILTINAAILGQGSAHPQHDESLSESAQKTKWLERRITSCLDLQQAVNCLMDSQKSNSSATLPAGYRQLLERKEGLFRKNMMGKRVNYSARSVISPDPYIATTEIGVPIKFAKRLTYPEPVTAWNVEAMRLAVMNGADVHPGANFVEYEDGRKINLENRKSVQRDAISKTLLSGFGSGGSAATHPLGGVKRVWRHLVSGDVLLVNRQPTLHKPGIMAHIARVLPSPAGMKPTQTIRMHYANCETYNADFDGDEINLHFPQDELARSEAYNIALNAQQYLVPTTGEPLRGLIQDHVIAGVKLTKRDTFLTREQYQQLVFVACSRPAGIRGSNECENMQIEMLPPTIWKPVQLWTGKQVVSTVLRHVCGQSSKKSLNMDGKSRIKDVMFGKVMGEHQVVVRDGELLQGVIDKGQIGATEFGLVHSAYEVYGAGVCAELLSVFGKLFTYYLQWAGHSCGICDLSLTPDTEERRAKLRDDSVEVGLRAAADFVDVQVAPGADLALGSKLFNRIHKALALKIVRGHGAGEPVGAQLDGVMAGAMHGVASAVVKTCLPDGLTRKFPGNCFALMTNSGAKGSLVNHTQVSCGLGQQALEGRRVPLTAAGRTLPCFAPFDPRPRAGGYVGDRFFSGVRPAEYYFHCMAGREGLVDTAVKTSRSGYLQRCLVKHLEDLSVGYDFSVRDSEGNMIQTLYGEDGLDASRGNYLDGKHLGFLSSNAPALATKYRIGAGESQPNDAVKRIKYLETCRRASSRAQSSGFVVGDILEARKQKKGASSSSSAWSSKTMERGWFPANVERVDDSKKVVRYHVRYLHEAGGTAVLPATVDAGGTTRKGGAKCMANKEPLVRAYIPDPILSRCLPDCRNLEGVTSEKVQDSTTEHVGMSMKGDSEAERKRFETLVFKKYMRDMVAAGENVGALAAQSIGEPSTQMTLNTFHLAGHGGANVTLGIPRLREVIMTASPMPKTPTMLVPLLKGTTRATAEKMAHQLGRLPLVSMLNTEDAGGIEVATQLLPSRDGLLLRYRVGLTFLSTGLLDTTFGVTEDEVLEAVALRFAPELMIKLRKELKQQHSAAGVSAAVADETVQATKKKDDAAQEDNEAEQGTMRFGERDEIAGYGEMDEEDIRIQKSAAKEDDSDLDEKHPARPSAESSDEETVDVARGPGRKKMGENLEVPKNVSNSPFFHSARVHRQRTKSPLRVDIVLTIPASEKKLILIPIIEQITEKVVVRASKGIDRCFVVEADGDFKLQTEGINFDRVFELFDHIDLPQLTCNGVYQTLCTYGVEAARASIVTQIKDVFGVYGIHVDPRHLGLLSDYMSFTGQFNALNRAGIEVSPASSALPLAPSLPWSLGFALTPPPPPLLPWLCRTRVPLSCR